MLRQSIIIIIVVLIVSSTTSAETTTEISGEYSITGTYIDEDNNDYQYYSHELDVFATIKNGATVLKTEIEITDKTWGDKTVKDDGSEFELDRAWLTHHFEEGFRLEVGKMTGGVWGTMLGDEEDGYYRVKATKTFGKTTLTGYLQKNIENGSTDPILEDDEKDDSDAASIGLIHKMGDIALMPKVSYTNNSDALDNQDYDGDQELSLVFAAIGNFNSVNFETEINYIDFTTDRAGASDYSIGTAWLDVNINLTAITAGISFAYGMEDNGAGHGTFGTDFTPMVLMDNDDGVIANLGGMMLARIYASSQPTQNLTTGCAFAYGDYNEDAHPTKNSDTEIMELDITARYAITEALSYSASIAYADIESEEDGILQIEHELVFRF